MRLISSSLKGSFCSLRPSPESRVFGFLTIRAGLRSVHSFDKQYSKKLLTMLMRRGAVLALTFHEDLNSRTSDGPN